MRNALAFGALLATGAFVACSGGGSSGVSVPSVAGMGNNHAVASGVVKKSLAPTALCTGTYIQVVHCDQAAVSPEPTALYYYQGYGTSLSDDSGNHVAAKVIGSLAFSQPYIPPALTTGHSISFANGYATNTAVVNTTQSGSWEVWARPVAADICAGNPRLMSNAWADSDGAGYEVFLNGCNFEGFLPWVHLQDTAQAVAGHVYHLVLTYDAPSAVGTFYVNGYPKATYNWTGTQNPTPQTGDSQSSYFGVLNAWNPVSKQGANGCAGPPCPVGYFNGTASNFASYNYALSIKQVDNHYNVGAGASVQATPIPPSPSPTAYPSPYPLGTPAVDNGGQITLLGCNYTINTSPSALPTTSAAPAGVGEFSQGFDTQWWGRPRGNPIGGNQYSGYQFSWGNTQYGSVWFADARPGNQDPVQGGNPVHTADIPYVWGPDPVDGINSLAILGHNTPSYLQGNPITAGLPYMSGILDTPIDQQYGYIEGLVKVPTPASGLSPAFWAFSNNGVPTDCNGPCAGEWDIQEMFGNTEGNAMNSGTIHWSEYQHPPNWGGSLNWDNNPMQIGGNTNLGGIQEATLPSTGYHRWGILLLPGGAPIGPDNGPAGPGYVFANPATSGGSIVFLDGYPLYGHIGGADLTQGVAWKELVSVFQIADSSSWLGGANINDSSPPAYFVRWMRVYKPQNPSCGGTAMMAHGAKARR